PVEQMIACSCTTKRRVSRTENSLYKDWVLTICLLVIHLVKSDAMKILTLPTIRILNAMHSVPDGRYHKTQVNMTKCKFYDKKE
uniref:hypothetical protein n=1 Tax=Enterobacter ludwigii TaxID=299767 RepID=UPI001954A9A7